MIDESHDRLRALVRDALEPVGDEGPSRELWPAVHARLDARAMTIGWWDWAIVTAAALWIALYPVAIPALLYYL